MSIILQTPTTTSFFFLTSLWIDKLAVGLPDLGWTQRRQLRSIQRALSSPSSLPKAYSNGKHKGPRGRGEEHNDW